MLALLQQWDVALFYTINAGWGRASLDPWMRLLSSEGLWLSLAGLYFMYAWLRKHPQGKRCLLSLLLALALADSLAFRLLKPGIERLRPCYQLEGVRLVTASCGSDFGFPSNHAANGMAIAVAAYLCSRHPLSFFLFLTALVVGLTRIYLGVHFPLDIIGGYMLGALCGLAAWQLSSPLLALLTTRKARLLQAFFKARR